MERMKMPRSKRAAQFAPFDALKGLHEALKMKEYEHSRVQRIDVSEEESQWISNVISEIEKGDLVYVTYYNEEDQHYHNAIGVTIPHFIEGYLEISTPDKGRMKVMIADIKEIENRSKPPRI